MNQGAAGSPKRLIDAILAQDPPLRLRARALEHPFFQLDLDEVLNLPQARLAEETRFIPHLGEKGCKMLAEFLQSHRSSPRSAG